LLKLPLYYDCSLFGLLETNHLYSANRNHVKFAHLKRSQKILLISLLFWIFLGVLSKWKGQGWVYAYGGGVIYVILFSIFFRLVFYRKSNAWAALTATLFTIIVETTQLWHPDWLEPIRQTFVGHGILGQQFSWPDMAHYILGGILGYYFLCLLDKLSGSSKASVHS
jgi:hypothetical protein